jgi:hypothetical protein
MKIKHGCSRSHAMSLFLTVESDLSLHMIRTVLVITMELVSGYGEIGVEQTLHYYQIRKMDSCGKNNYVTMNMSFACGRPLDISE